MSLIQGTYVLRMEGKRKCLLRRLRQAHTCHTHHGRRLTVSVQYVRVASVMVLMVKTKVTGLPNSLEGWLFKLYSGRFPHPAPATVRGSLMHACFLL